MEEIDGDCFRNKHQHRAGLGKRMTWTGVPTPSRLQVTSNVFRSLYADIEEKKEKETKRETPEHTTGEQGASYGANKTIEKGKIEEKEKGLHAPKSVPQTMRGSEPGVSRRATDHEMQQAQDQENAARAGLAMGTDPPSWIAPVAMRSANPRVVAGELPIANPQGERSAASQEGISSGVRIRGLSWNSPVEYKGVQSRC